MPKMTRFPPRADLAAKAASALAAIAVAANPAVAETDDGADWVDVSLAARLHLDVVTGEGLGGVDANEGFVRRAEGFIVLDFPNDVRLRAQPIWIAADSDLTFNDLYLQAKLAGATVKVGHFHHLTLDQTTSSANLFDMERHLAAEAFDVARKLGAIASWTGVNRALDVAVTGQPIYNADDRFDGQWALSARAMWSPIIEQDKTLHLAANVRLRESGDGAAGYRYRARPGARELGRYVDTDYSGSPLRADPASRDLMTGGEAAWIDGPLTVTLEAYRSTVLDGADFAADAFDLNIGWYLTGESQPIRRGRLGRVKPKAEFGEGGYGAVQARFSLEGLDLDDGAVRGGRQIVAKAGLTWTLNDHVRIYAEHVVADISGGDGGVFDGDTKASQIRVGLDF